MIDLWTLFVVNMFQSFWMTIVALSLIMYIIFMVGKCSQYTAITFISIFILAMAIGYGYSLISIGLTILILVLHMFAIPRLISS